MLAHLETCAATGRPVLCEAFHWMDPVRGPDGIRKPTGSATVIVRAPTQRLLAQIPARPRSGLPTDLLGCRGPFPRARDPAGRISAAEADGMRPGNSRRRVRDCRAAPPVAPTHKTR